MEWRFQKHNLLIRLSCGIRTNKVYAGQDQVRHRNERLKWAYWNLLRR